MHSNCIMKGAAHARTPICLMVFAELQSSRCKHANRGNNSNSITTRHLLQATWNFQITEGLSTAASFGSRMFQFWVALALLVALDANPSWISAVRVSGSATFQGIWLPCSHTIRCLGQLIIEIELPGYGCETPSKQRPCVLSLFMGQSIDMSTAFPGIKTRHSEDPNCSAVNTIL